MAGSHNLFVYGTLLAEEVLLALLSRPPRYSPAFIPEYHRYSVENRIYPAASFLQGGRLTGKVLFGLSDEELQVLDKFEDVEYKRLKIDSFLLDDQKQTGSGDTVSTYLYIWGDPEDKSLHGSWNYEGTLCKA